MTTFEEAATDSLDHDVVIVGGGPAGCSAGVFVARYGLDTVVFDRGRSSIQRCAHLENYLGFPGGIDIETFYALMHDHATRAGCEIVPDFVESVESRGDAKGFVVETQEGRTVTAGRVIAATRYDGEYLRPLDDDEAMFETYEYDGETHERFDRSYADHNGTTSVDGLYVASPAGETDHQAILAAGRGARVGLALLEDVRQERGYPATAAAHYDWLRRVDELDAEWSDRDRWREWFADRLPDDHGLNEEDVAALRESEIDRRLEAYLPPDEIEARVVYAHERLLDHFPEGQLMETLDDDLILESIPDDRLLESIPDDRILEYARQIEADRPSTAVSD